MAQYNIIKIIQLKKNHLPTGNTHHYRWGQEITTIATLKVVLFPSTPGYYLIYFDAQGNELTDTFHEELEGAFKQAEFEFNVKPEEWLDYVKDDR